VPDARGALVLMALWPLALLFPAAVPFGLGQVLERLEAAIEQALADTPFMDWMPMRDRAGAAVARRRAAVRDAGAC
jgi:hypothetical protein